MLTRPTLHEASLGCATSSQVPFKAFLSPPELHSRIAGRKLSPLLSPLQDSRADKTLLEPREIARPKKVCFSESNLPTGDRSSRTYYLNGMVHTGGPGWGKRCSGDLAEASFPSGDEQGGKPGRATDLVMSVCPGLLGKKMELLVLIFSCKICACDSGYKSFGGLPPSLRVLHGLLVSSRKDETIEHSHVNFLIVSFCGPYTLSNFGSPC